MENYKAKNFRESNDISESYKPTIEIKYGEKVISSWSDGRTMYFTLESGRTVQEPIYRGPTNISKPQSHQHYNDGR